MTESVKITGKTYTLYDGRDSTEEYYERINNLIDRLLLFHKSPEDLLDSLRRTSRFLSRKGRSLTELLDDNLSHYITGIDEHLAGLSLTSRFGSVLSTKRYQYYIYMIEAELTGRINKEQFLKSEKKIALLPHCLRDLSRKCMSEVDGLDYRCRGCSKNCFINKAGKILKEHNIDPYIWKEAARKKVFLSTGSMGILGIACLPELVRGLRYCSRRNIPAVGIPLDANRCMRWMGDFYDNSINLDRLKKLLFF